MRLAWQETLSANSIHRAPLGARFFLKALRWCLYAGAVHFARPNQGHHMKDSASQADTVKHQRELPFRLGVLIDPAQLAHEVTTVREAPSLQRHAIYMTAMDRELRAIESDLVPRAAQLVVHTRADAAAVIALTIQVGGTQYRVLLPVLSAQPLAWLDESAADASCLIAVDVTDQGQLALVRATVAPAHVTRVARARLDVLPELTDEVLAATARSVVDLATRRLPSLVSGFGVDRVEVVVVTPSERVPLAGQASSHTVH